MINIPCPKDNKALHKIVDSKNIWICLKCGSKFIHELIEVKD